MSHQIKDANKAKQLIDKIPYLKDFERKDKETLANLSFFREYSAGEVIIEQDAPNQELFFLIRGKVDILVEGNHVVSLRGGGRIFGEMSFMNHSFTSASVVASTDLVMMVYKIPGILSLSDEKHATLKINLYKSIAEMLAQKLKDTTDLAQAYKKMADKATEDL